MHSTVPAVLLAALLTGARPRAPAGAVGRGATAPRAQLTALLRRDVVSALAGLPTSVVTVDSLELRLFRMNSPTPGRASGTAIPDTPAYYQKLVTQPQRLTPEAVLLRNLPTTCPPVLEMVKAVLRLDAARQLPPSALAKVGQDSAFWGEMDRGADNVATTLAESPPLLRLFVPQNSARQMEACVSRMNATLLSLKDATGERDARAVADAVYNLALCLEELGRLTVGRFPYSVPRGGRFETLPRLLGRGVRHGAGVTPTAQPLRGGEDPHLRCPLLSPPPLFAPRGPANSPPSPLRAAEATLLFKRVTSLSSTADSAGLSRSWVEADEAEAGPRVDRTVRVRVLLDGYAAPISAGTFADLALRGFYNGLPLYDGLGLQANKSAVGKNALGCGTVSQNVTGFVNPFTGEYRTLPLEYKAVRDSEPMYLDTDEPEDSVDTVEYDRKRRGGRDASTGVGGVPFRSATGPPALPFQTDGVLGLFHPPGDPQGASSQFFWLANPERDGRKLDGRYAPFGVCVEGYEGLLSLRAGDMLEAVTVDAQGARSLKRPGPNPQYTRRSRSKSLRDYNMLSGEYMDEANIIPSEVPVEPGALR